MIMTPCNEFMNQHIVHIVISHIHSVTRKILHRNADNPKIESSVEFHGKSQRIFHPVSRSLHKIDMWPACFTKYEL